MEPSSSTTSNDGGVASLTSATSKRDKDVENEALRRAHRGVREVEEPERKREHQERSLTEHLNKWLLSSFLDKLNQRDLALAGIQRLDCAVAQTQGQEDSNRAAEEW